MNRAVLAIIGLALVIIGSFFLWKSSRTLDPVVRGQRLSTWLSVLSTDREGTAPYSAAAEAIHEAGTNGLPLMVRMLQTEDSSASRATAGVLRNQHVLHAKWTREWDVRLAALRGLKLLGPAAESATARLGELMGVTNFTMEATLALLQMGRPALTEFSRALTNQEPMVRCWAAVGIRQLHNEQAVGWGTKPSDGSGIKSLFGHCCCFRLTARREMGQGAHLQQSFAPTLILPFRRFLRHSKIRTGMFARKRQGFYPL